MGEENVAAFRTGLYARPPPMSPSNPHWHGNETKYMYVIAVIWLRGSAMSLNNMKQ